MHDGSLENVLIQDHHLIKKSQILCLNKLNSNELCKIQIIIKKTLRLNHTLKRFSKTPIYIGKQFIYNLLQ